jgi:signal transduction histidine kinase
VVFEVFRRGYDRCVIGRGPAARLGVDVVLCLALLVFGVRVTTRPDLANGTFVDTLLLPVVVLPILLRWRWPLGAAVALFAGTVISAIPTFDQFRLALAVPAALLILFPLASRYERRRALAGLGVVLAAMVFVGETDVVLRGSGGLGAMVLFSFPLCLVSWGAGRAAWSRERLAEQLAARSELLVRQRERTAELAVEVERERLASELDLAARDRVREMIELAADAEQCWVTDPAQVVAAFARIEVMGRESLNEMRDLLGLLRSDDRASRAPRPTLAQLDTLLQAAREGGRLVELETHGHPRALPLGVELAAYRALQHALLALNPVRGEPATIRLRYLAQSLEFEVRGARGEGASADGAVVAARERILAHGGSFSSEQPSGIRVLRASLPVSVEYA